MLNSREQKSMSVYNKVIYYMHVADNNLRKPSHSFRLWSLKVMTTARNVKTTPVHSNTNSLLCSNNSLKNNFICLNNFSRLDLHLTSVFIIFEIWRWSSSSRLIFSLNMLKSEKIHDKWVLKIWISHRQTVTSGSSFDMAIVCSHDWR